MSGLRIETDWVDMSGDQCPELDATFANLSIRIGDEIVTTVHNRKSRTIQEAVLVPLYPLAEWIASNWWTLNEETEILDGRPGFAERHSLFCARNGFCIPDLRMIREGESVRVEWSRYGFVHAPMDFISEGSARLPADLVRDELIDFIEKVTARLESAGIHDSSLQQEWEAIQAAENDPDETSFCRAAAWLGLDPFDLPDEGAARIIALAHKLPAHLREDAFRAARGDDLPALVNWIEVGLSGQPHDSGNGKAQERIRRDLRRAGTTTQPWKIGYDAARYLRSLEAGLNRIPTPLELLVGDPLPVSISPPAPPAVDALTFLNGSLYCYTAKRWPDSQRFIVARALFDFLALQEHHSLLSRAITTRQSEGRAFAAELLAPADYLKERITSDIVTSDELSDLAEECKVSAQVIEHQIRNHKLAAITI